MRDRERVPAERSVDVVFHEFMADERGTVAQIYERAVLPMTAEAAASIDAFLAENARGKHGQVAYDLPGDFGVDPDEVRRRFDFYFARFPIRPED